MVGVRCEKIWRIQCCALVKVRLSRPLVRLIISKRTTPSKKRKLSFESQEQILCIDYGIVRTLARNGPKTCPQRQDTAKILVCLDHFSASVHFIATESPEYIVKLAYIPLSISLICCGVSYAHLLP